MASNSTTLYSSNYPSSNGYTLTATIVENSTSTINNTSNVTITATLKANGARWAQYSGPKISVEYKDNGNVTTYTQKAVKDVPGLSSTTDSVSVSWTGDVTHNDDGTLTGYCKAVWTYKDSGTGYAPKSGNVEVSLALTNIPRAGSVTTSPASATVATTNNTTIFTSTVTPANSAFYHLVSADINGTHIGTDIWAEDTNYKYYVKDQAILNALGSSTTGTLTVTVTTYQTQSTSSTLVGTKTYASSISINTTAIKPSIASYSIAIKNTPLSGYLVAGYSTANVKFTTTKGYGATSVTTTVSLSRGTMAASSSTSTSAETLATNTLPNSTSNYQLTATITATDSRGASATVTTSAATVYGYSNPVPTLNAYRVASASSTSYDEAGTYVYITFSATSTNIGNTNPIQAPASSASSTASTITCKIGSTTTYITTSGTWKALAESETATITYTARDKVSSGMSTAIVSTAMFPIDCYQVGTTMGVAIAGVAQAGKFTSSLPFYTSYRESVAVGSYQSAQVTIPNLVEELRFSSGVMGSANITTAYTNGGITIPIGWYNYIYSPHRSGGKSGVADRDNCNYGTLLLANMTGNNGMFRIRVDGGAIGQVVKLIDSPADAIYYGSCSTAAATQAKVVTVNGPFALVSGVSVRIHFTTSQTYNGQPTLNVNSTGDKPITQHGTTAAVRYYWYANSVHDFVYDGTSWVMVGGTIAGTTYYGLTKLSSSVTSTSTALAATASAVKTAYDLAAAAVPKAGSRVLVWSNTSGATSGNWSSFTSYSSYLLMGTVESAGTYCSVEVPAERFINTTTSTSGFPVQFASEASYFSFYLYYSGTTGYFAKKGATSSTYGKMYYIYGIY